MWYYVGQTSRPIIDRLKQTIIEQIYLDDNQRISINLLQREAFWICKLETISPNGMNKNFNLSIFFITDLYSYGQETC